MNVLFFNRSFYPTYEATGQFLTERCEDLVNFGNDVTVIAGRTNSSSLIEHDKYGLVNVIRVGGTNFNKSILIFRLINLGTYFLMAFIAGFMIMRKPHVIIAQTDPPVLGLLGYFFSKWYKAKFIYSCKDIYPEIGLITGKLKNPFLIYLLKKINLFSFRTADKILCLGEDMKRIIVSKGIPESKIDISRDWADTDVLYPIPHSENPFRSKYKLEDKFVIIYSGNIGLTQNLEKIIEVANHFQSDRKVLFMFIGEGANKVNLENLVGGLGLTNVMFLPYQSKEELKYSLSAADLHLITLEKGLSGLVVPSKIYGILACGRPFLACVDNGSEIDYIARMFDCGVVVNDLEVKEIIEVIKWAKQNPQKLVEIGLNGRKAALEFFDRKSSIAKFNEVLQSI